MEARGCIGESKYCHWRFAQSLPAHVLSLLSSRAERYRSNRRRRKLGPDSVFSMRVSNGQTVTPVFPTDRCGKPCEILHCALEHFHSNCARGKELNAVPCLSRTPIPALKAELSTLRRSGTFYFALTAKFWVAESVTEERVCLTPACRQIGRKSDGDGNSLRITGIPAAMQVQ